MNPETLPQLEALRSFFDKGLTRDYSYRRNALRGLKRSIQNHEMELYQGLYNDLRKSDEESWVTETGMVIAEINAALKGLASWMRPERVRTNLLNFPSTSRIIREPLGVVLIVAPWNYPFQLLINPLVGAIAAGNCVVLKPSEFSVSTNAAIKKMLAEAFPSNHVLFVEGEGAVTLPPLIKNFRFDHIFYTGSTEVGRIIYKMAAENLVPVTLELGGKSPCLVEEDANLQVAAKRIALTKFSNAGQMCVAPDYLLVHSRVKDKFLVLLKNAVEKLYGSKPAENYNYGRLINEKHFDRVSRFLEEGSLVHGGKTDKASLLIEPAIIENVSARSAVMTQEIFGPVLPVIPFSNQEEAFAIINRNKDPLAFYLFTSSREKEKFWLSRLQFGGGCINNASWHLTNHHLPFGGRGYSGMGNYHGRYSFETFSHKKSVMKTPTWFDPAIKYPPFKGKLKLFKLIVR